MVITSVFDHCQTVSKRDDLTQHHLVERQLDETGKHVM